MKTCGRCRAEKDEAEFGRSSKAPDGLRNQCKACRKDEGAARADTKREYDRKRYVDNRPAALARAAEYRQSIDPTKQREYFAAYYEANRGTIVSRASLCRAPDPRAAPAWRNDFFIEEAYDLAARRTEATGFPWQVDHIVPLVSRRVCGLHAESNIRVVPALINHRKGNRTWPDMPE